MAFLIRDFVKETSTTTGLGAIALLGARSPGQTLSTVLSNGDTFDCAVSHDTLNEWEVFVGTYNSGPNTISRGATLASSNGGSPVSFSVGTKRVDLVDPAVRISRRVGPVVIGATTLGLGSLSFSNANGVSWGLSTDSAGGTITASAAGGGGGGNVTLSAAELNAVRTNYTDLTVAANAFVLDRGTANSTLFSSNNVSFRFSSNSVGAAAALVFIANNSLGGVDQATAQNLSFRNSHNVSLTIGTFSTTNLGVIARIDLSAAPQLGLVSHVGGNSVVNATRLAFSNASNVTWSLSTAAGAATVFASVAAGGGGGADGFGTVSLVTDVTVTTPDITAATDSSISGSLLAFAQLGTNNDSHISLNNVAFRLTSNTMLGAAWMSYSANGGGLFSAQVLSLANTNGNSWTLGTTTVAGVGRVVQGTLRAAVAVSASTNFNFAQNIIFRDAGGITWSASVSLGSISLTGNVGVTVSGGASTVALNSLVFSDSHNVSFGLSGSTITASVNAAAALVVSNTATSVTVSRLAFTDLANRSFLMTTDGAGGATIGMSLPLPAFRSMLVSDLGATTGSVSDATQTQLAPQSAHFPMVQTSLSTAFSAANVGYRVSNNNIMFGVAHQSYIGGGSTIPAQAVSYSNANGISFSVVTSNVANVGRVAQVFASYTVPGAPAATRELGIVSHVGGNVVSSVSQLAFSNASNVTFSLSTAAGAATLLASVNAGGGAGVTHAGFLPNWGAAVVVTQSLSNGTLWLQPLPNSPAFTFDRMVQLFGLSNATNATNSNTLRMYAGLYSRNASTLSLISSSSTSVAFTGSGTVGNYSLFSGPRNLSMGWNASLPEGDFWIGVGASQLTAGNNSFSISFGMLSQSITNVVYGFGLASNATFQSALGKGFLSATTSAPPSSIAFSQIQGTNSVAYRFPALFFGSGTA